MIQEIKRKWNQHKCISSPQNKDYWRNCWAFLELQASTKTIQIDAVLGYKISTLVCFWTICSVATNVMGKQSWWQRYFGWCPPSQADGDWNPWAPGAAGMQQQQRLDHKSPKAAHKLHLQEVGTQSILTWEAPCTSSLANWGTMTAFMLGFSFHQLKSEMC